MRVTASYLERVAREWQAAYSALYLKEAPAVKWERGWFKIQGASYRRKALEEMRDRLRQMSIAHPLDRVLDSS